MTRLEMVEKVREKTGVSYETARSTLEGCQWDMLDAVMELNKGETVPRETQTPKAASDKKASLKGIGKLIGAVLRFFCSLLNKGEKIRLKITKNGEEIEDISLTVLILLALLKWWVVVILILIGLFTGFRCSVEGSSATGKIINKLSDKAGEKAEEIKQRISEE